MDIVCFSFVQWCGLTGPDASIEVLTYKSMLNNNLLMAHISPVLLCAYCTALGMTIPSLIAFIVCQELHKWFDVATRRKHCERKARGVSTVRVIYWFDLILNHSVCMKEAWHTVVQI